ncbi:MAG TPA: hypothetical protein VM925_34870, partial [Labilithrix sp.]|nr:hypothetical protein [Labilithrix sp.]
LPVQLGRRRMLEVLAGSSMPLSAMLAGCRERSLPEAHAPTAPVTGTEGALAEMKHLRAALDQPTALVEPTNGWDGLEKTEWPFLALIFFAAAATRLAALAPGGSKPRDAALADARWALERARRRGIPGATRTGGVALLPDGHLFVALERFARVAQSDEHLAERRHLASAFERAFAGSPSGILPSYPSIWWTLDAVPALAGLALHGSDGSAARKWEATVRAAAIESATGLIRAVFDAEHQRAIGPVRGCALMLAFPELNVVAPAFASEQWELAKTHLVRTLEVVAFAIPLTGVREYPEPLDLPANVDSGRIVMGLGESASGFGLAAAAAMNDLELLSRLLRSARLVAPPIWEGERLTLRGVAPVGQAAMLRAKVWSAKTLLL